MNKPSGLASKLRALLKAKETPMWGVIIVLVIVIIFQQIQISELQWRVDEDHDGSSVDSVAGRLYILEGMANKHSDQLDEILKDIRQLQNDGAKYDWELKQLQWRVDEDHDGASVDSVAGRLYILEGMANKHSDQLDNIFKDIRQLQNDGAKYDWELKQLQWLHPELKVRPPEANPSPFKSTDLNLDMNPGKVPDVIKQSQ